MFLQVIDRNAIEHHVEGSRGPEGHGRFCAITI
jgi:hypothetical protein